MRRRHRLYFAGNVALISATVAFAGSISSCSRAVIQSQNEPRPLTSVDDLDGKITTPAEVPVSRYFTEIGKKFVEPSARILVGKVVSISALSAGPNIARVQVERWILTPEEKPPQTIVVGVASGILSVNEESVLLFLAPVDRSWASLHPFLGVARGEKAIIDARVLWLEQDVAIAKIDDANDRIAAARARFLDSLASENTYIKTWALQDAMRSAQAGEPVLRAADGGSVAALATRQKDRDFALRLLDLANLLRSKSK